MIAIDILEPRRLFAAGAIDTAFGGGDGSVDVRVNAHGWTPAAVDEAVDGAGRALLAGVYGGKHDQVSVARVTADGVADASFGAGGIATLPLPLRRSGTLAIAVDARGRTLLMISTDRGTTITRLTDGGTVDRKFGRNGTAAVPVVATASDLVVDASGNVVIVGASKGKTGGRSTVVRMSYRGRLDATFGSGGAYKAPVPLGEDDTPGDGTPIAVRASADGRITCVETGAFKDQEDGDAQSALNAFQLDAQGKLRTAYGTGGFIRRSGSGDGVNTFATSLDAIGDDGRLVLANFSYFSAGNPDGSGDTTDTTWDLYDADGRLTAADERLVPEADATSLAGDYAVVAVQPDGKLIVDDAAVVYRLNADRTRDDAFHVDATTAGRIDYALAAYYALPRVRLHGDDRLFLFDAASGGTSRPSTVSVTALALGD